MCCNSRMRFFERFHADASTGRPCADGRGRTRPARSGAGASVAFRGSDPNGA